MPQELKTSSATELLKVVQSLMQRECWQDAAKLLRGNSPVLKKDWKLLWNLGWCYFRLERFGEALRYMRRADELAPTKYACKYGLGSVYLKKRQYKKAERVLSEALQIKESHAARISLALAYLAQGKIEEAERMHLENIKLRPNKSARYVSYAAFLWDVGREAEAKKMELKAKQLQQVN